MQEIGKKLGADVPAAFIKSPLIARGIGEEIEEIKKNSKYYIVLIKPDFSCNTKEMYEKLDNTNEIEQAYNSKLMKIAIESGDIQKIANNLYNVFEGSVYNITWIKEELIKQGAMGALMTGSGSCVYGIFEDRKIAKDAFKGLSKEYEAYFSITR
ncbi:MAG: hypothetical protein HFJ51_02835 [Clostridia bacterium]|nr:hypothetical protein [Clostridia bacterium]